MTPAFIQGRDDYKADKGRPNPFDVPRPVAGQSPTYYWREHSQEVQDWCRGWLHAHARSFDQPAQTDGA